MRIATAFTRRPRHWILACALAAGSAPALAIDVPGGNTGPIPDNSPAGRSVTFDVANMQGRVRSVAISVDITHAFIGDLEVRLLSPSGVARLVLFSRAGFSRAGGDGTASNLDGTYTFSDAAGGDLWAKIEDAGTDAVLPPGSYRTTTAGRPLLSDIGGCSTHLDRAFGGLSGIALNGQWTLEVIDRGSQDTGAVAAATLSIEADPVLFSGGFEQTESSEPPPVSSTRGRCKETLFDFTGTGLSSYAIVHPTTGDDHSPLLWSVRENTGGTNGALVAFEFGTAADTALDGDYDGDGIRDAVLWSQTHGTFTVRRSSRPNDVPLVFQFDDKYGNSTIAGDYDGDGVTDAAVYTEGSDETAPSYVEIALSRSNSRRVVQVGLSYTYATGGLDLDGDHRADITIQSVSGEDGTSRFELYSGTGQLFDTFALGSESAYVVPGNHVGFPQADVTLVQSTDGVLVWTTRDVDTGLVSAPVPFGTDSDTPISGDYDGDGLDDHAVWHGSATPGTSAFHVRRSSNPVVPLVVPAGIAGDQVVAESRVN